MNSGLTIFTRGSGRTLFTGVALALFLAGCGGGGGSAGTTGGVGAGTTGSAGSTGSTGTGSSGVTATAPTIKLALFNGTAATSSINSSGVTTAQATVLNDLAQPVKGKLVTFTGDPTQITFNPPSGTVLTDSVTGVATIQISPATVSGTGAGSITATTTVTPSTGAAGVLTTGSLDYQLSAANLTLTGLNVATTTPLAAYGTRTISVVANINGSAATNTPVQVTFSASCGTVSPAIATTDGTGKASSSYTANSAAIPGCTGANVNIAAAATGATSQTSTIMVQPAQATNIQFVSATPQLIYLAGSVGATQSQVSFKLVDATGNGLPNQGITLSLNNTSTGVSIDTVGSSAPVTRTTDSTGNVSVPVFSGTIPTSVQVVATLASNTVVSASSNILAVASGVPVQSAASLSLEKFSIEGLNVDGTTTKVTFSMADRQGNPVPVGTSVNFVTGAGVMVPATCKVAALADGTSSSSCSVTIRSQGTRPANGRVAILAYTGGEENFTDINSNNIYDSGDGFDTSRMDIGDAYRDDNFNGVYDPGEFTLPRYWSSMNTNVCNTVSFGRQNGCDGKWSSVIDVRDQKMVIFASSTAVFTNVITSLALGVSFSVQDTNGNSMPTGTTIAVAGRPAVTGGSCTATAIPTVIPNVYGPKTISVRPVCSSGDFVDVTITSPLGVVTPLTFKLTP